MEEIKFFVAVIFKVVIVNHASCIYIAWEIGIR